MFFLKPHFHNWHIQQMCHMGRVVSSQLVVLLAISAVAGEKTQKMILHESNSTQSNFNY